MTNIEILSKNLERRGFHVSCFNTAEEACTYLDGRLDGQTIGFGGSVTVRDMGLYDRLKTHNTCLWHWDKDTGATPSAASAAPVYICSVNGVAETGELVNIDGACNRVAATMFGPKQLFLVVGENKIVSDLRSAIHRARNVAAPLNARRLSLRTPCTVGEAKCHDCASPDRICAGMTILMSKPKTIAEAEVIIIRESLGF